MEDVLTMSGVNCTETGLYHNLLDAVSVCLRQYDPVRYARRGAIPSQYFMGREYPWNEKEGTYGRWVTGRGGAKYFIKLEDAVQRELNRRKPSDEEFAAMFGKRPTVNALQTLRENMLEEEIRVIVPLAFKRRGILSDNKRDDDRVDDKSSLQTINPDYAGKTIALYKTIPNTQIKVLAQRRVYDENGVVLQDFDYWHGAGAHIFPHIHIWLEPSFDMRSGQIAYR